MSVDEKPSHTSKGQITLLPDVYGRTLPEARGSDYRILMIFTVLISGRATISHVFITSATTHCLR